MSVDITYHYPPALFELLIEAISKLCKSKPAIIDFFIGAGVSKSMISDIIEQVRENRDSIRKIDMVRSVLTRLNQEGETTLRTRREVIKRIVEWSDFSTCWPDEELAAQGLVTRIQKMVDERDTATKLNKVLQDEIHNKREKARKEQEKVQERTGKIRKVREDLFALFTEKNPQKRGKALEGVLNRLFEINGILVREAFTVAGSQKEGVVEQIDGVVEIDSRIYIVEMKWLNTPVDTGEVSHHLVRIYNRAETHGIFISASGYTKAAIDACKEALQQKIIVLSTLEEFVHLLNAESSLKDFLQRKIQVAILDKNPLFTSSN